MGMHLKRATIAENIVIEFLPSARSTGRVIIVCDGMPSVPGKKRLLQWLSKKGFFAINLRYRGTWESGGTFLDHDPTEDVRDVITALDKPITDAWGGEDFMVNAKEVFVIGASFGGTASLLSALDKRVKKVVSIAPVIDWTQPSDSEPMDWLEQVLVRGYAGAIRFQHEDWLRLSNGELFQPMAHEQEFDPSKIFIIHAQNDTVVPVGPTKGFVERIGCKHLFLNNGGHLGSSVIMSWKLRRKILSFLDQ